MNPPFWEHVEHEADIGIRGVGRTPAEAFEQAALAMTAVILEPARVAQRDCVDIQVEAPDLELLLVDWLNAILYEMARRSMLFSRFTVNLEDTRLSAKISGEPVDPARHQPAVEVKGASYGGLRVVRRPDGDWSAECIVDV